MKRRIPLKFIAVLLCIVLISGLFSACTDRDAGNDNAAQISPGTTDDAGQADEKPRDTGISIIADSVFSLKYDSSSSFNPLTGDSADNMVISQLIYEGLFKLDAAFEAVNVLCESYTTADGLTYEFTLLPGVEMHDGSTLTAADAVYSLTQAAASGKYVSRLAGIQSVTATGDLTFTVVLTAANYSLPEILDVPIIKSGSAGSSTPPGTGPYTFNSSGTSPCLNAFHSYRDYASLPLDVIYLKEFSSSELTEAFSTELLDFLQFDPTGYTEMTVRTSYESRRYDTTVLQYVGFNTDNPVLADSAIRCAISHAVDREDICQSIMNGSVRPALVALSPALGYYNTEWESGKGYSITDFSHLVNSSGMDDGNSDGFLEYGGSAFTLDFIVNEENKYKVAAAQEIADSLRYLGFDVTLTALPWNDYIKALQEGDFDLYYGEVQLPADFDLSTLLVSGGALNYGGIDDPAYPELISAFLAAADDDAKAAAAQALCAYIYENAPFIPILYKMFEVDTQRGMITGIVPVQSDVFGSISSWSVSFG